MEITLGYNHPEHKGQSYFSPSITVQDDALSIREILVRFAGGQSLPPIQQEGSYPNVEPNIDDPLADYDPTELTDLQEMINISNERAQQYQNKATELKQQLAALQAKKEAGVNQPTLLDAKQGNEDFVNAGV